MKKNIMIMLIMAMTAVFSMNICVYAETEEKTDYDSDPYFSYSYTVSDDNSATITRINPVFWKEGFLNQHDLIIPDSLEGHTVKVLGEGCGNEFSHFNEYGDASNINGELRIPDSVEIIEERAFTECIKFTKLTLGSGLKTIGKGAFSPSWSQHYSEMGFKGNLIIPEKVTDIGDYAFYGCSGFTSLSLPDSLKTIGEYAFSKNYLDSNSPDMSFTGNLNLADGLTSIGDGAFLGCSGLSGNLIIPDSVTSVGFEAFEGCSGFDGSLSISKNLSRIESGTFQGCSGLSGEITIPSGVGYMGKAAFRYCRGLTGNLVIPNGVTELSDFTFEGCSGLDGTLSIPESVTNIGCYAFDGCEKLNGKLTIPLKVKNIDAWAFRGCSGFTGILTIPDSVTKIETGAFEGCSGFAGFTLPKAMTEIPDCFCSEWKGLTGELIIPGHIMKIGGGAFTECSNIGSILIPNSVKVIDDYAFQVCESITEITIPNSVAECGENILSNCYGLKKIVNRSKKSVILPYSGPDKPQSWKPWKNAKTGEDIRKIANGVAIREDFTGDIGVDLNDPDFNPSNDNMDNGENGSNDDRNGSGDNGGNATTTPVVSVSDNKPMNYSPESRGDYRMAYNHDIPFWGKTKPGLENFGEISISCNKGTYKANKIKVNKKKHLIQITGLEGADKDTVKEVKKATKGANGLPFKVNPYYVKNSDTVTPKKKKDGSINSVKVNINGKDYKVKKGEWTFDSGTNTISFTGVNVNGSYKIS